MGLGVTWGKNQIMPKWLRPKEFAKDRAKTANAEINRRVKQRKDFQKPGCYKHTESSIEGSMENSILVAKPQLAIKHRKNHMTGKQQENQCLISTYDLDLNMHLLIYRS